jgi:hypothetical protein
MFVHLSEFPFFIAKTLQPEQVGFDEFLKNLDLELPPGGTLFLRGEP